MSRSEILENIRIAFDTLRSHLLRSFLTILGVVVGTTTVIVIAAFVSGIDTRFKTEVESFGARSLFIYKFDTAFNINPSQEERTRAPITVEDGRAIRDLCPDIENVAVFLAPEDPTKGPLQERPIARFRDIE